MEKTAKQPAHEDRPPVVREYDIGGVRYIVTSKTATGAYEDAATKIRRLIRRDLSEKVEE